MRPVLFTHTKSIPHLKTRKTIQQKHAPSNIALERGFSSEKIHLTL